MHLKPIAPTARQLAAVLATLVAAYAAGCSDDSTSVTPGNTTGNSDSLGQFDQIGGDAAEDGLGGSDSLADPGAGGTDAASADTDPDATGKDEGAPQDGAASDGVPGTDAGPGDDTGPGDDVGPGNDTVDAQADQVSQDATGNSDGAADAGKACPGSPGCACTGPSDCDNSLCLESPDGKTCAQTCTTTCPGNQACAAIPQAGGDVVFACVYKWGRLCNPCQADADCAAPGVASAFCASQGAAGAFCGAECSADSDCPPDYACGDATSVSGKKAKQCLRKSDPNGTGPGTCPCSAAAVTGGASTICSVDVKDSEGKVLGTCKGQRVCKSAGLTPCEAKGAGQEVCDGADNDCNGVIDDGLCKGDNPCVVGTCVPDGKGGGACENKNVAGACDDGNVCTSGDECDAGTCKPGSTPKDCNDKNPCTIDTCDSKAGCTYKADSSAPCDDGNACTVTDLCSGDTCVGKAKICDDGLTCTADSCEAGNCVVKALSDIACDDGNLCTSKDTCVSGSCAGAPVICDDKDPCTKDACDAAGGKCIATPASGAKCDDGSLCTLEDTCASGKCSGVAKTCTSGQGCFTSTCDAATGNCAITKTYEGEACDDGNVCTQGDVCFGNACKAGVAKVCNDSDPCTTDACSATTGLCVYTPAAEGQACDDGKPCTVKDVCVGGKCSGPAKDCGDGSVCTTDDCDAATGKCSNDANAFKGKPCPGLSAGICQNGVCLSPSTGKSVAITAGDNHTCSIKSDGNVQCWGANSLGQLGVGNTIIPSSPLQTLGVAQAVAIAAGSNHTCAVAGSDKSVLCWGSSAGGQAGLKTNIAPATKILIAGSGATLNDVISVAAGTSHSCALRGDRKVYCWGTNAGNELGQGDVKIITELAMPVVGLTDAIALSARAGVTCALTQSGQTRCWGNPGKDGSLGTLATFATSPTAIKVPAPVPGTGLTHVSSISVGGDTALGASHACVTKTDGSIWCFGANLSNQLGTGNTIAQAVAVKAANVTPMRSVVSGVDNACAIDLSNQLWCWGSNANGRSGQAATQTLVSVPTKVSKATNVGAVALGATHGCILRLDGEIYCWGSNTTKQLGSATAVNPAGTVQPISAAKDVANTGNPCADAAQCTTDGSACVVAACVDGKCSTQAAADGIACDDGNSCTLAEACKAGVCASTAVACTDSNACTQDECATMVGQCIGTALPGGAACGDGAACVDGLCKVESKGWASSVSVGSNHACALRRDGTVWCWGTNTSGQLGDGTLLRSSVPVQVINLKGAISVSAGGDFSCAVDSVGGGWCWGKNTYQNLGDGSTSPSSKPLQVTGLPVPLTSVVASRNIAGHGQFACGLGNNGVVYCWGYNAYGECGQSNSGANVTPPKAINFPGKVVRLAGGLATTCFYDEEGHVGCFGYNDHGSVGAPDLSETAGPTVNTISVNYGNIFLPVIAQNMIGVRAVAQGKGFGLAANQQGEVWGWGHETKFAELTVAQVTNKISTPAPLAQLKLKDVIQVAAGGTDTPAATAMACVRSASGEVQCWGDNAKGQVGADSAALVVSTPATVKLPGIAIDLSVGENNACVVLQNGSVWCWGDNIDGLVGNNVFGGFVKVATQVYGTGPLADGTATGGSCTSAESCADDGNVCTAAICQSGKCAHEPGANGLACEDGNLCTTSDACTSGTCTPSKMVSCDDKNPCTTDYCAPDSGVCVHAPIPGGSTCAAGKVCALDSCVADTTSVGYVQVAGMTEATCGLRKDGTVWCWGSNSVGQLGTTKVALGGNAPAAVQVELPVNNIVSIDGGGSHACAIDANGGLYCWGGNASGQIGKGLAGTTSAPAKVTLVANAKVVSAGGNHTCAINVRGKMFCWGSNGSGQLGLNKTVAQLASQAAPLQVVIGTSPVRDISAGDGHTCAVTQDKSVYCWGQNTSREAVPNSGTASILLPVAVNMPKKTTVQVVAGNAMSCARADDGPVYCWGLNTSGQLGFGVKSTTVTAITSPQTVPLQSAASRLFGGNAATMCVSHLDGSVECWGINDKAQVGIGDTNTAQIPQTLDLAGSVKHLSFGLNHACAINARGDMLCWGSSSSGKLGTGATWDIQKAIAHVVGVQPALFGAATGSPCKADYECKDDGNVCTVAYCDAASKTCKHSAAPDGIGCGYSNACTAAATCKAGACQLPSQLVCNDNIACTDDLCAESSGQCLGMNLDASCP